MDDKNYVFVVTICVNVATWTSHVVYVLSRERARTKNYVLLT